MRILIATRFSPEIVKALRQKLNALREKRIAGAGMDVYHREPLSPDDPLTALDNVILTPHIAVATRDVVRHHSRIIYNDLQLIANGEPPVHVFNSDVMPSFLVHSGQLNQNPGKDF